METYAKGIVQGFLCNVRTVKNDTKKRRCKSLHILRDRVYDNVLGMDHSIVQTSLQGWPFTTQAEPLLKPALEGTPPLD